MRGPSLPFVAIVTCIGLSICAFAVPALALPGFLLASIFWPQGVHTGAGLSTTGGVAYVATLFVGDAIFWGGAAVVLLRNTRLGRLSRAGRR
jgi:hypothetical protein